MPPVEINYLAVVVSAVVAMGLGAWWYSPAGFGKLWMQLSGMSDAQLEAAKQKGMAKMYAAAFAGTLITAYVLAHFVDYTQATTIALGIQTGFWSWLGFVATVTLGSVLWENKPLKLYALNNAYQLISLMVMGAMLAVWV